MRERFCVLHHVSVVIHDFVKLCAVNNVCCVRTKEVLGILIILLNLGGDILRRRRRRLFFLLEAFFLEREVQL